LHFPPQLEWTYCPAFGNVRKTYVRDLGAGIGPRPTKGTTRPYDVGAIVTYSADVRVGIEAELAIEPGTVDVDVVGTGRLQASTDTAVEGAIVRIETSFTPDRLASGMRTRFPEVDMSIGSFIKMKAHATAQYAGIDHEDGSQLRATRVLYDADTLNSDLDFIGVGGEVRFWDREWLGLRASPRGLQVRFLELPVPILEPGIIRDDVFVPMKVPGPQGDLISPPPGTPLFSHADYAVLTPELDTPAASDFDCGGCPEVARSFVDDQGRIVSTTPVGTRNVLAGAVSDRGFTLPFVNDGIQDADVLRLDIDVDSVSYALGVPLGVSFVGPKIKYLGAFGPVIAIELNAIDFDIASFWSFDQLVRFDPRMRVRLEFSKSVSARVVGDSAFAKVSRLTVPVGTPVEFRQRAGGVKITPVFLLDQNRFENDTELMVTPTVQGTLGQVRMSGLIPSMVSGAFELPTNAAVLQWTPGILQPINLGLFGKSEVVLGGFKAKRGRPVSVATGVAPDGQR
jgi:hypothetical protein